MIIGIPVYQGVDLLDVTAPHEVFKWLGDQVEVRLLAASTEQPIVTRDGFRFLASHRLSDAGKLDVLWVPGGDPAMLAELMDGKDDGVFLQFLRRSAAQADWVCSVCEGALLLAKAGAREVQRTIQYFPQPPFKNDLVEPAQCMFSW